MLLRDGDGGLEVLLGKRSSKLKFHGGAWVFPGGRIDPEDYADDPDDLDAAARRAAAREAKEEAGVDVDPDTLVHFSNWTTPEISPKRFATWFFVGPVAGGDAIADGAETDGLHGSAPTKRSPRTRAGEIELAPPQYVTLLGLRAYGTVAEAMAAHRGRDAGRLSRRASTSSKAAARSACTAKTSRTTTSRCSTPTAPATASTSTTPGWNYLRD